MLKFNIVKKLISLWAQISSTLHEAETSNSACSLTNNSTYNTFVQGMKYTLGSN
jgi:hypothetical protein